MKIRLASTADLPGLAPLGLHFAGEGAFSRWYKPEQWQKNWAMVLEVGLGEILVAEEDGRMLGGFGLLYAPDLNDSRLNATEAFWFVDPARRGCGLRLMKAAIARAQEKGAVRFLLAHLCGLNEGLGRLYERSGFHPVEQLYVKEF